MEKQLKDYLHLYLGVRGRLSVQYHHGLEEQEVDALLYASFNKDSHSFKCFDKEGNEWEHTMILPARKFKPILRPLSDMTEEEAFEMEDYMWEGFLDAMSGDRRTILKMFTGPGEYRPGFEIYVRAINWCRSHSFDCDGLIDSNLAISKTK